MGKRDVMYHLLRADEFDAQRAPIVFVHGNPAWSFEFRHPVRELRSEFRCVALDHIGFGLSSRSARREDHRPQSHAQRLAALLDHLDLRDITLFMNDWGGPIGLDFARRPGVHENGSSSIHTSEDCSAAAHL